MTASQSLKIYEILQRHFNNDADARIIVQEIEQIVENKFETRISELSPRSDVQLLRKDMETIRVELSAKIESSSLRVENNLRSEINKLIVWIIATMFGAGALFITIAKLFFNK